MINQKAHADFKANRSLPCYKSTLNIVILFFSFIFAVNSFAAEPEFLPLSKTKSASDRIERFLIPGTQYTGGLEQLRDMEVEGLAAIHLIFKMVLQEMNRPKVDDGARLRVGLLLLPALQNARARPKIDRHLLSAVKAQADQVLEIFDHRSADQDTVIAIFNYLDLWSADNFWFFLKYVKNRSVLMNLYPHIRKVIPLSSEAQLAELAKKLRAVTPADTLQMSLLMDTGGMTERELTTFFKLVAQRFSNRQALRAAAGDDRTLTWQDRKDEAIAPALKDLKIALEKKDHIVASAFKKARADQEGDEQTEFYRQFAGESAQSKPAHYETDKNVILVNFKLRTSCRRDLR